MDIKHIGAVIWVLKWVFIWIDKHVYYTRVFVSVQVEMLIVFVILSIVKHL